MLAICLVTLVGTSNASEAFPPRHKGEIAFSTYSGGTPNIYVMNADGSDPTPLADEHLASEGCDWSPDGTKIAFTYIAGVAEDIYVINADGSGQTNLTRTYTESERDPDWSPDGTRIAFERGTNEDVDIYTINPDGSDVAQLTHTGTKDMDPDWRPLAGPTEAKPERQQEQAPQNKQQQASKNRSGTVHPPDTGGPSLLLVASALLLFSGGVMFYAGVRSRI